MSDQSGLLVDSKLVTGLMDDVDANLSLNTIMEVHARAVTLVYLPYFRMQRCETDVYDFRILWNFQQAEWNNFPDEGTHTRIQIIVQGGNRPAVTAVVLKRLGAIRNLCDEHVLLHSIIPTAFLYNLVV